VKDARNCILIKLYVYYTNILKLKGKRRKFKINYLIDLNNHWKVINNFKVYRHIISFIIHFNSLMLKKIKNM